MCLWIITKKGDKKKHDCPGPCVKKVIKHYGLPSNIKTTKSVVCYCLKHKKPIFWGIRDNNFHIDHNSADFETKFSSFFDFAMLIELFGEAQTDDNVLFSTNDIEFLNGYCWKNKHGETKLIDKKRFSSKFNSRDLIDIIETCPFGFPIDCKPSLTTVVNPKNLPITSRKDLIKELNKIWSIPMFMSFFGLVSNSSTTNILYSKDFNSSRLITKPKDFLPISLRQLHSASIMCNNQKERTEVILDVLVSSLTPQAKILIVSQEPLLNIPYEYQQNTKLYQRNDIMKQEEFIRSFMFDIIIIDGAADFKLRSKYAEILLEISTCTHMLLLFDQDTITNYLQLSGVKKLKDLVPELDGYAYIQKNILRLSSLTSENQWEEVVVYIQDPNLPQLMDEDSTIEFLQEEQKVNTNFYVILLLCFFRWKTIMTIWKQS